MAKTLQNYIAGRPGVERVARSIDKLKVASTEGALEGLSANRLSNIIETINLGVIGGGFSCATDVWTQTLDNSATLTYAAADGGILLTSGTTDDADLGVQSKRTIAVAANKRFNMVAKVKVSHATTLGFQIGFAPTTAAEYFTSAAADCVIFQKPNNSATISALVIENGNAADTLTDFYQGGAAAALAGVADTYLELGIDFTCGATTSSGSWWVNGIETPMTANQVAALTLMLNTTPPAFAAHAMCRVDGTDSRTATVAYGIWERDR